MISNRKTTILMLLLLSPFAAWPKTKDKATGKNLGPRLSERRDEPLQETVFFTAPDQPQCEGTVRHTLLGIVDERFCWDINGYAKQSFDAGSKKIGLRLNLLNPPDNVFDRSMAADLILAVDGYISKFDNLNWVWTDFGDRGVHLDSGITMHVEAIGTLPDDSDVLIRKLSSAKEVWVTIQPYKGRISFKLSPTQIAAITMIVDKYDSLTPLDAYTSAHSNLADITRTDSKTTERGDDLADLDRKLTASAREIELWGKQGDEGGAQCADADKKPPAEQQKCVLSARHLLLLGQTLLKNDIALLDKKIGILAQHQNASDREASDAAILMKEKRKLDLDRIQRLLVKLDNALDGHP